MIPETVAALFAVAKLGAIFLPIFSGYGADAVAVRLEDAGAVALVTADGFTRRGQGRADEGDRRRRGRRGRRRVHTVVVVPRLGRADVPMTAGRDLTLAELVALGPTIAFDARAGRQRAPALRRVHERHDRPAEGRGARARRLPREDRRGGRVPDRPAAAASGCSGSPTSAGSWGRGRSSARSPAAARSFCYDGAPDYPGPDRLWAFVERHRVNVLGVSPTLIRALMAHGDEPRARARPLVAARARVDRRAVERRPVALVLRRRRRRPLPGHQHLRRHRGRRVLPRRRTSSQPISPCSLGGPALGMAVDVFDDDGQLGARRGRRARVHEAVAGDDPRVCTGPAALPRDVLVALARRVVARRLRERRRDDGQWFLHGRSDDTIKLAGKRLGPAEVETVVVAHPAVVEAAAIGVPDELKGEALWVFVVLGARRRRRPTRCAPRSRGCVADALGPSFKPAAGALHDRAAEDAQRQGVAPRDPRRRDRRRARRPVRLEDPATLDAIAASALT